MICIFSSGLVGAAAAAAAALSAEAEAQQHAPWVCSAHGPRWRPSGAKQRRALAELAPSSPSEDPNSPTPPHPTPPSLCGEHGLHGRVCICQNHSNVS